MGSLYIKTFFVPFPLNICCPTHALATVLLNRLKRFPYQELLSKSDLKLKEEALWIRDAVHNSRSVWNCRTRGERQELVTGLLIELGENHEVSVSNKLRVSLMLMCLSSDKGQKAPRPCSQKLVWCCWLTAPLANLGKQIKMSLIKAMKGKICVPCIFLSNWYPWDGKGELAGPPVCGTSIWCVCCMHIFMKHILGAGASFLSFSLHFSIQPEISSSWCSSQQEQ